MSREVDTQRTESVPVESAPPSGLRPCTRIRRQRRPLTGGRSVLDAVASEGERGAGGSLWISEFGGDA